MAYNICNVCALLRVNFVQNTLKIMNSITDYSLVKPQVVTQIKYEPIEDDRADFCRVLSELGCANYPYVDYYFN